MIPSRRYQLPCALVAVLIALLAVSFVAGQAQQQTQTQTQSQAQAKPQTPPKPQAATPAADPAPGASGRTRGCRSRWTRSGRGSSTCRRTRRTSRSAPTTSATSTRRTAADARYPGAVQGHHRLPEGRRTGAASATSTSRRTCSSRSRSAARRATRRWSGCTAACTATGASRCSRSSRRPSQRGYVVIAPGLPRQHRLRRGVPPGDRLRRLRGRRRDVGGGLPEDAAARRSGPDRHHGLEPRRLHHAAVGLPRQAPVQGRRGDRAGDEPRVPAVVQGPGLPVGLRDAEADPGPAVREARHLHRALAALPRGQAEGAAARARGDERPRT